MLIALETMRAKPITEHLRGFTRIVGAGFALALALIVLVDVSQAGRRYVYCTVMQDVMSHPCCDHAASRSAATVPVLAAGVPECCQTRSIPSLGTWTPASRVDEITAPWVAIVPRWPLDLLSMTTATDEFAAERLRRPGQPLSRSLARLMVLRI
jgi:hypothetical protein